MALQKYGKQQRLLNNQRYSVKFKAQGVTHEFSFTSRYTPLYSTAKIVRNDLGDLLTNITDDTINFSIWQTSLLVTEIATDDSFTNGVPNFAVKQYVRYQTEYNILRKILLILAANAGDETKTLGEFSVIKGTKAPYVKDLLGTIGAELKKWEAAISTPLTSRGATKALTNFPYPLNDRVGF